VTFFKDLQTTWQTNAYPPIDILLGDFNIVEDTADRLPAHSDSTTATTALLDFCTNHKLVDGWHHTHPHTLTYTFLHSNHTGTQSHIDHIYTTDPILKSSRNWSHTTTAIRTDHKLTTALISRPDSPYIGKGCWAILLFLLQDSTVRSTINNLGIELTNAINNLPYDRTDQLNAQTLFSLFKTKTTTFA